MIDCSKVTRLITHASCADGLASAMIIRDAMPDVEVTFAQYGRWFDALPASPGMLFCDITPPRERAAEFVAAGAIVLDHHLHARDIVELFGERGRFADEAALAGVSGAALAYEHVWEARNGREPGFGEIEDFARLVGIRDTWQVTSPDWATACDLQVALLGLPQAYWLRPGSIARAMTDDTLEIGRMWRDKRGEIIGKICDGGCIIVEAAGTRTWAVFPDAQRYTSDVAEVMRERGVPVTCGWFQQVTDGGLETVLSLRSDGDAPNPLDVGALCKAFGGGGHSRAAGCTLQESNPLEAVRKVMARCGQ